MCVDDGFKQFRNATWVCVPARVIVVQSNGTRRLYK